MGERILIIEDEAKIARILNLELTHEGYSVELADTGRIGLEKGLTEKWDLILLDIMLPELNGMEVLRRLRNANCVIPVILLTARGSTMDKVSGLDLGANDYITKPFEIEELLARVRACLRYNQDPMDKEKAGKSELSIDDLVVNRRTREVIRNDHKIELTPKEFDLLVYLLENSYQVLTREQIIGEVWGYEFIGDTNVVDVYIRYVRKKIDYGFKNPLIHTIRGIGYCLKEEK